jgi:ABC-2 type transport system permease protein
MRFKLSFVFSYVSMFVSIAIFYFINLFVGEVPGYGNYFTFVLIGLAINQFTQITLTTYLQTMHTLYWSNWLEILLTSPTRTNTFFTAVMIWNYLYSSVGVAFYFLVGIIVFGATFTFTSTAWVAILLLVLLVISLSGIGLISASMFLLANAKGSVEPIGWVISTISGLVAGVYFPPEFLPKWVQSISWLLPQTYAIDAIRKILLQGDDFFDSYIQLTIVYLIVFSIILIPLGLWMFRLGIRKAEREGTLARWQ